MRRLSIVLMILILVISAQAGITSTLRSAKLDLVDSRKTDYYSFIDDEFNSDEDVPYVFTKVSGLT
ncbi:MAG: hypothetical protein ACOCWO_02660, partial [Candidatus Muiribacteriaceae bacterium]